MKRADIVSAVFWVAMGLALLYAGWDLELGSLKEPGSGFLIFWTGLVMAGLALAVLAQALRRPPSAEGLASLFAGARWAKVAWVLVALLAYGAALPSLGFLLTTTGILLFLFKIVEPQRWAVAIAGALGSAVVAYVVFRLWLGAQLPAGLLGVG